MLSFVLSIELGNAAMSTNDDVAKALRDAADKVEGAAVPDQGNVRDANGNTVGWWAIQHD